VLAGEAALDMIRASAGFRFQIDTVGNGFAVRLTRHKPSAVIQPVQAARRRDNQTAFFSGIHGFNSLAFSGRQCILKI
jgi:hypothetical protein